MNKQAQSPDWDAPPVTNQKETVLTFQANIETMGHPEFCPSQQPELRRQITEPADEHIGGRARCIEQGIEQM